MTGPSGLGPIRRRRRGTGSWLILAGRGAGKTRAGAEAVRQWAQDYPSVNLIGPTADDVRDVMVLGESGILNCCRRDERPRYLASAGRLEWPSGAVSLLFSAEEPDRLRGKQHMKLWLDELAAWRRPEAFDQAMLGLRLGDKPQMIVTTTPRPTRIIKELAADKDTIVTRGSSTTRAIWRAPFSSASPSGTRAARSGGRNSSPRS